MEKYSSSIICNRLVSTFFGKKTTEDARTEDETKTLWPKYSLRSLIFILNEYWRKRRTRKTARGLEWADCSLFLSLKPFLMGFPFRWHSSFLIFASCRTITSIQYNAFYRPSLPFHVVLLMQRTWITYSPLMNFSFAKRTPSNLTQSHQQPTKSHSTTEQTKVREIERDGTNEDEMCYVEAENIL